MYVHIICCTPQGTTYYWGTPDFTVSDSYGSANESFRVLLKFGELYKFLPAGATINQATLNLTFINWDPKNTYTLKVGLGGGAGGKTRDQRVI